MLVLGGLPAKSQPSNTARTLGTRQLVFSVDQTQAYLNGEPVVLSSAPKIISGRTLLPLRTVANLLEFPLISKDSTVAFGRLNIDVDQGILWFKDQRQPDGSFSVIDNDVYVPARLVADATDGNLSVSEDFRTLILTVLSPKPGESDQPRARFSTNKTRYAQGEPVLITDYSFDPNGLDLVGRTWTGKETAYFAPGVQTLTLQVTNQKGLKSVPYTRNITISTDVADTPLSFALKYATLGTTFPDNSLPYPRLTPVLGPPDQTPLYFSDSPERVSSPGILYADNFSGSVRLVAHHVNGLDRPARVYIWIRNLEDHPIDVISRRLGEASPAQFVGILGQGTLLDYFADTSQPSLHLPSGEAAALYASPTLSPDQAMSLMSDLELTGQAQISTLLLEEGIEPTTEMVKSLPVLPTDGRHTRGTFPGCVRHFQLDLKQNLPAKLVIGDAEDGALVGIDALTGTPSTLLGNYGVLYDILLENSQGVVAALAARGGPYKGAISVTHLQTERTHVLPLPASGILGASNKPILFMRAYTDPTNASQSHRILFVPATGSNLPVHLIFYRPENLPEHLALPIPKPLPVEEKRANADPSNS